MAAPTVALNADFFNDGPDKIKEMMDKGETDGKDLLKTYFDAIKEAECKADPAKCKQEETPENEEKWEQDVENKR